MIMSKSLNIKVESSRIKMFQSGLPLLGEIKNPFQLSLVMQEYMYHILAIQAATHKLKVARKYCTFLIT